MIELKQFQLRLVKKQCAVFNFERASLALLASYKRSRSVATYLQINSEWRDPLALRHYSLGQKGGRHHG